jgi:hypothetical protein
VELSSSQSSQKIDLSLANQIISIPLESGVLLLFDDKNDITGLDTGSLITLAREFDLVTTLHTLVDVNLQDLSLLHRLLSVTVLALVFGVNDLSGSFTITTRLLNLLNHRSKLTQVNLDSLSSTSSTLLDGSLLSTKTIAALTDDGFRKGELLDFTLVEVF